MTTSSGAYESDTRTLVRHQAYCSCGWRSTEYLNETQADGAADRHDETHARGEQDAFPCRSCGMRLRDCTEEPDPLGVCCAVCGQAARGNHGEYEWRPSASGDSGASS